jgi:glycosyltransferase involved in cell wall biosynthesis
MKKNCFSIILPTFNRESNIAKSIQSVINQTFLNWELIIIDDGSTDNTKDVVLSFNEDRIRYVYQENAERSTARNNGIRHADGEWICFLDSDDYYLPHHLFELFNEIEKISEPRIILTGNIIDNNGEIKKHPLLDINSTNILKEIWSKFILMNSVCVHHSLLKCDLFDENYRIWEDTHLWIRLASKYYLTQLSEYTCVQQVNPDGTVLSGMKNVRFKDVKQYVIAVNSLKTYPQIIKTIKRADFRNYIDNKLRMYLYQSRKNKQLNVSIQIWTKAILNKPSLYLLSELPKIFLNKIGSSNHE